MSGGKGKEYRMSRRLSYTALGKIAFLIGMPLYIPSGAVSHHTCIYVYIYIYHAAAI